MTGIEDLVRHAFAAQAQDAPDGQQLLAQVHHQAQHARRRAMRSTVLAGVAVVLVGVAVGSRGLVLHDRTPAASGASPSGTAVPDRPSSAASSAVMSMPWMCESPALTLTPSNHNLAAAVLVTVHRGNPVALTATMHLPEGVRVDRAQLIVFKPGTQPNMTNTPPVPDPNELAVEDLVDGKPVTLRFTSAAPGVFPVYFVTNYHPSPRCPNFTGVLPQSDPEHPWLPLPTSPIDPRAQAAADRYVMQTVSPEGLIRVQ
jgi:hypothetical protein